MERPILPVGYIFNEKISIKNRINSIYKCETYELLDWRFLYLFLDIKKEDILTQKLGKFENILIKAGWQEYIWIISNSNTPENIIKFRKELTELVWFEKIAWMKDLKILLINEVIEPFKYPEKFKKYKLWIPNGILFFWPPGCGKTFITRRLAEELWFEYLEIKHSDIWSPYIHWSVGKIAELFDEAKKKAPCIVFIDELSALVPKRENLDSTSLYKEEEVNEILMHLNDASSNRILVIWATNFPDRIDSAIQRSWRIDKKIYIWPPDSEARMELFKLYLNWRPVSTDINYVELSKLTENYVTSDIELIVEDSARNAFQQDSEISMSILLEIIRKFKPSIWKNELEFFQMEDDKNKRKIWFAFED